MAGFSRRDLLRAAALCAAPLPLSSLGASAAAPQWQLGWRSIREDRLAPLPMDIEGDLPAGLHGQLLRNGPARFARGDRHYAHWIDGDGMLQAFRFHDSGITHEGRFIETERYIAERAAGRILYNGAGTHFPDALPGRNNDSINVANTALLPWENEVLALWEGGSAYRIDPASLDTLGLKTWREDLQHAPFSAHPLVDRDGTVWNFGFAPYAGKTGRLALYRLRPAQGLTDVAIVTLPFGGYLHDFALSEHHLVFLIPPYHFAGDGESYVDRFVWEPSLGSRLLLVDKNDLSRQRWFDLPAGFVFHFGHAATHGHELHLQLSWYDTPDVMREGMREVFSQGRMPQTMGARAATVIADFENGIARLEKSDTWLEFPGFDEQAAGVERPIHGVGEHHDGTHYRDTLTVWQPGAGERARYVYPWGTLAEEPLRVRDENGEAWLLQSWLDTRRERSGLSVFSAADPGAGPVAEASMPRLLPLGFHGCWLGA